MMTTSRSETPLALTQVQREKLDLLALEVKRVASTALASPVRTEDDERELTELLGRANVAHKELELLRREVLGPLEVQQARINEVFRGFTAPLKQFVERGKGLVLAFKQWQRSEADRRNRELLRQQEEAAKREAAEMRRAEEAMTGRGRQGALARAAAASREQLEAASAEVQRPSRTVTTETTSATTKAPWTFEVVNESEVPREYLSVDDNKIRRAVQSGVREIPGVYIYQKDRLDLRVRKS